MQARVFFTAREVASVFTQEQTVIVVDVLRATSTIVAALAAGARTIYPVAGTEEALRLAFSLGREDTLLCGERKGRKVPGFDLGNSPLELTPERVGGKRLVMSTTNGTPALLTAAGSGRVMVGALLNLKAVARAATVAEDLTIVCAGREGRFALEDALGAGLILERIAEEADEEPSCDDGARAARTLAGAYRLDRELLRSVVGGDALVGIGMERDIDHCAKRDLFGIVPEMQDRMIRAADGS